MKNNNVAKYMNRVNRNSVHTNQKYQFKNNHNFHIDEDYDEEEISSRLYFYDKDDNVQFLTLSHNEVLVLKTIEDLTHVYIENIITKEIINTHLFLKSKDLK